MFKVIQKIQSSAFMSQPRQLSFSFRSFVAREPACWLLYQPYIWWAQMKLKSINANLEERVISPDKQLVIDGCQGSANSFAIVAFKHTQAQYVKLACHLHSPAQIIQAIKQEIPVLLTIREPVGTVLSMTSRWPHLSITQALMSYIKFYSKLESYADYYVISTFEQTTQHLDHVVQKVNTKFGTNFDLVNMDVANIECKPEVSDEPEKAAIRKALKQQKRHELTAAKNVRLLAQANEVYQAYEVLAKQMVKL